MQLGADSELGQAVQRLAEAISAVAAESASGELLVAGEHSTGKLHFHRGAIAWITSSNIVRHLRHELEEIGIPSDILVASIRHCLREGLNFGEFLLRHQIVDQEQLRSALLRHNTMHFRGLLEGLSGSRLSFTCLERHYSSNLLFSYEEIASWFIEQSGECRSSALAENARWLALRALGKSFPACVAVALIDRVRNALANLWCRDGGCLERQILVPLASHALGQPGATSTSVVVIRSEEQVFVVQRHSDDLALLARFDSPSNPGLSIALARHGMRDFLLPA